MTRSGLTDVVGAVVLLVVLLGPTPSWGHSAVSGPLRFEASLTDSSGSQDATAIGSLLLAALGVGIGSGLRRPRRLVAGLVTLLLVFAFEAGLHSAHHLGNLDQSTACPIGVTCVHLVASPVEAVTVNPVAAPLRQAASSAPRAQVTLHRPAPHEGRAPPASIL